MRLKYENYSLGGILDIQTTFRLQKLYCKNYRGYCIKNENHKTNLCNKEQEPMVPVVTRSGKHFGFEIKSLMYSRTTNYFLCFMGYSIFDPYSF